MNLSSKLLSSLLALFLFVPAAFAEDGSDAGTDKPEILKVKGARIWVPEGGFVERGEGLYLNTSAAISVAETLGKAAKNERELVVELNKANEEAASRFPVQTAVIIGVVCGVVGAVAGGVAVGLAVKK
jgi:hypothetical protein